MLTIDRFVAIFLIAFAFQAPKPPDRSKLSLRKTLWKLDPVGISVLLSAFICLLLLLLQCAGIDYRWSDSRVWGWWREFGLLILAFLEYRYGEKTRKQPSYEPLHEEGC